MATPVSFIRLDLAQHLKNGFCNVLFVGDSISTQNTDYRMPVGIAYAWRPSSWRGWSWPAGGPVGDDATAGGGGDRTGMVAPGYNYQWQQQTGALPACNRYCLDSGVWAHTRASATYDRATGSVLGTPIDSSSPGFIPNAYREQQFTDVAVPNDSVPAAGTAFIKLLMDSATLAKFYGGDPFASLATTGRMVFVKAPVSPAVNVFARRTTNSANTAIDLAGTAAYAMAEASFPVGASADMQLDIANKNPGTITPTTPFIVAGTVWYKPNATTGLLPAWWANSGWHATDFADTSFVTNANLAMWMSMFLGNGLGSASPSKTNGPTVVVLQVGENQDGTEQTELNAGTSTTFKTNIRAIITRLNTVVAINGCDPPKYLIIAPYQTTKSATNNTTMSAALWEIAQEIGASFIDLYQAVPGNQVNRTGRSAASPTDLDERWLPDQIHPNFPGALSMAQIIWNFIEDRLTRPLTSGRTARKGTPLA